MAFLQCETSTDPSSIEIQLRTAHQDNLDKVARDPDGRRFGHVNAEKGGNRGWARD
jgi:phage tail protein X